MSKNLIDIENLREKGFTQDQIDEIQKGINQGLDVNCYLNSDLSGLQMYQIRLGLLQGYPVETYCQLRYDWFQMEEIRKGLRDGLDITRFNNPELPYRKMRELRKALKIGLDISDYLEYPPGVMREYRLALAQDIQIGEYIQDGYDADQLEQIRLSLSENLPISEYLNVEYGGAALTEIRRGLEDGIDVTAYVGKYADWRKMREIRLALNHQLDISRIDNTYYSWQQMREIRLGLLQGLNVERYSKLMYPASEMRRVRLSLMEEMKRAQEEKEARESIREEDYTISFGENNLEARFTYNRRNEYITEQLLRELLEKHNVCYGIKDDALKEIVDKKGACREVVVAEGIGPENGKDGWYEFFFRTHVEKKPKELEDGSVDYLNVDWFEIVEKDQKLASYHEPLPGKDGIDVFGQTLHAKNGTTPRVLIGNGFRVSKDHKDYYATIGGKIELDENRMNITNHLRVDGVSMTSGNLVFNGSAHVRGNVEPGMVVDVTGDLEIDGMVAGATIRCGANLVLKKGINANNMGSVIAKGNIESRYFEAVEVTADGDIRFNTALNSKLYAKGQIVSTTAVAGGNYIAEGGFQLRDVGNKAWIKTEVDVVRDEQLFRDFSQCHKEIKGVNGELETLTYHHRELDKKLKEHQEMNKEFPAMDVYLKLEDAIYTKKMQQKQLEERYKKLQLEIQMLQASKVVILGTAYPGVVVNAGDFHWKANEERNITINVFEKTIT